MKYLREFKIAFKNLRDVVIVEKYTGVEVITTIW